MSRLFRTALMALAAVAFVCGGGTASRVEAQAARLQWNARTGAFPAAGGVGSIAVNATSTTNWSLSGLPSWISVLSGSPWWGSGVVSFSVAQNTGDLRTATISANGVSFTIRQAAGTCTTEITPSSAQYSAAGVTERNINVRGGLCQWSPISTETWLTLKSAGSSGSGAVYYGVAAGSERRSAAILVGTQVFTVDQDGTACGYYTPSPVAYDVSALGGYGSFDLILNSNCPAWTVTNDSSWVTLYTTSGTGPGTVVYSVEANPYDYAREAVLIVNGNPHFVRQAASDTPGYLILQPGPAGSDTSWGSAYYAGGTPNDPLLTYGGSGDRFHDYFYIDVTNGFAAAHVSKAEFWVYVTTKAPNDPHLQMWHLTQPWSEAGVNATSWPGGLLNRNLPPLQAGWNRIDITDLFKRWRNGTYSNYGIMLAPAATPSNARGYLASSDYTDSSLRPRIVLTYQEDARHTALGKQKMLQVVGGSGYQEVFYHFSSRISVVSPYTFWSGAVPYDVPAGEWVGMYHYDYAWGQFTQAVYNTR